MRQHVAMTDPIKGRLLVATPGLVDPNFDRTVILMLDHTDEGAIGLVLNRPSELDLEEPLPAWSPLASAPSVVFVGGPVSPSAAIALARGDSEIDGWTQVFPGVGIIDVSREPGRSTAPSTRCDSSPATPAGGRRSWNARSSPEHGS